MTCQYRFTCIATVGPTGIHACPHCGAMVKTAQDPEPYCRMISDNSKSSEYIDRQESVTIEQDTVLEAQLGICKWMKEFDDRIDN